MSKTTHMIAQTQLSSTLLWHICSAENWIAKYTEQYNKVSS